MSFEKIHNARQKVADATTELHDAVAEHCPGPHEPRRHPDGLAPWCRRCGRTADGQVPSRKTVA